MSVTSSTSPTSSRSLTAKYGKPAHNKVSQMLGYALTLDSSDGWWGFHYAISQRLPMHLRAAMALMSLKSLPPEEVATVIAIFQRSAGSPSPYLLGHMDEAAFWADMASPTELDAYCLASFRKMSASRQQNFLRFVSTKVAA